MSLKKLKIELNDQKCKFNVFFFIYKKNNIYSSRKCVDLEHEMKNLHHQLKSFLARIDDVCKKQKKRKSIFYYF
jgi:hypothetical protein